MTINTQIPATHQTHRLIVVRRNGHHLSLDSDDAALLSCGRTRQIISQSDSEHGYRVYRQQGSLLRPRDGLWRANAGLLPALRLRARQDGGDLIEFAECEILALPDPLADRRIMDTNLGPYLHSRERGLIRLGSGVGIAEIVAEVVAACANCRIAVLGTHRPQLHAVADKLAKWLPDHQILRSVPPDDRGAWTAFSTFTAAADGDLEKCHLVLLLDATHAIHQHAESALATMNARFRLFGLLRHDRRQAPSERDILMATFGPAVLDVSKHGFESAVVNVAWLHLHGPKVNENLDTVALFRNGIWQHPSRNRNIARLATALRDEDSAPMKKCRDINRWMADCPQRPPRVTILVDNVEHALALGKQLPGWPIVAGENNAAPLNTHGLSRRKRRMLEERRSMWLTGGQQIVAQSAAPSLRLASTDILIWAGGGRYIPEIPRHWLLQPVGTNHRLLIVDIQDRHNPQLDAWSDQRRLQYIDADWFDVGLPVETGRVIRFLCQRPRRKRRRGRRAS